MESLKSIKATYKLMDFNTFIVTRLKSDLKQM